MFMTGTPRVALLTIGWLLGLFLILPTFVVFPVALNDTDYIAMPGSLSDLSLRHFVSIFTDPAWLSGMRDSAIIGVISATLATILGTAFAIGTWRVRGRWPVVLMLIVVAPMLIPSIVSAVALYRMWTALGLYDTWIGVVLAHTILATPFAAVTVSSSLSLLDPKLEQVSRSLGASRFRTIFKVILPNVKAGVIGGALFSFILSWDEIVVTLFVANRVVYTLPRKMWDGIKENIDPAVAAVSAALVLMTIALMLATSMLRKKDSVKGIV